MIVSSFDKKHKVISPCGVNGSDETAPALLVLDLGTEIKCPAKRVLAIFWSSRRGSFSIQDFVVYIFSSIVGYRTGDEHPCSMIVVSGGFGIRTTYSGSKVSRYDDNNQNAHEYLGQQCT